MSDAALAVRKKGENRVLISSQWKNLSENDRKKEIKKRETILRELYISMIVDIKPQIIKGKEPLKFTGSLLFYRIATKTCNESMYWKVKRKLHSTAKCPLLAQITGTGPLMGHVIGYKVVKG